MIWTALNIDYPGHSFSHLGLFFGKLLILGIFKGILLTDLLEGLNGRLPNQDLLNSVQRIARYTGQVPVTVYDHLDWRDSSKQSSEPSFLPSSLRHNSEVKEYTYRARNLIRNFGYQAKGRASGVHGLYHQYANPFYFGRSSFSHYKIPHRCDYHLCCSRDRTSWFPCFGTVRSFKPFLSSLSNR